MIKRLGKTLVSALYFSIFASINYRGRVAKSATVNRGTICTNKVELVV